MKKIILLISILFVCSGCSLLPRVNFGQTPNTVPQRIDKSKAKEMCKGEAQFNDSGAMIYCSKGYYVYSEGYQKEERKMTVIERIKSFINNLVGWGFWGFVLLLILCPSLIGFVFGRLIESVFGVAKHTLDATIRAVQKARKQGRDLNDSLDSELDTVNKQYIRKIKDKEKIK